MDHDNKKYKDDNKKYKDDIYSIIKGISILCVDEIYEGYPEPTILTFMQKNKKNELHKTQISSNNSAISGSTGPK